MIKALLKVTFLTALLINTPIYAGKIIKWVDKNGVTHYGDKPPMPNKVNKSSVLNNQGVTVKKIDNTLTKTEESSNNNEQSRYDKALLETYSSVDEIDLAKARNIRIDELALTANTQKHETVSERLIENKKRIQKYTDENKEVPEDITIAVDKDTKIIASLEKKMAANKAAIAKIEQRYESDKLRYIELQNIKK